jgi:hypothetical protein
VGPPERKANEHFLMKRKKKSLKEILALKNSNLANKLHTNVRSSKNSQ